MAIVYKWQELENLFLVLALGEVTFTNLSGEKVKATTHEFFRDNALSSLIGLTGKLENFEFIIDDKFRFKKASIPISGSRSLKLKVSFKDLPGAKNGSYGYDRPFQYLPSKGLDARSFAIQKKQDENIFKVFISTDPFKAYSKESLPLSKENFARLALHFHNKWRQDFKDIEDYQSKFFLKSNMFAWQALQACITRFTDQVYKDRFLEFTGFTPKQYDKLQTNITNWYVTGSAMAYVGRGENLPAYANSDIDMFYPCLNRQNLGRNARHLLIDLGYDPSGLKKNPNGNYSFQIPGGRKIDFYVASSKSVWNHHVAPARMYLYRGAFYAAASAIKSYQDGKINDIFTVFSQKSTQYDILKKYAQRGFDCSHFNVFADIPTDIKSESKEIPKSEKIETPSLDNSSCDAVVLEYKTPNFEVHLMAHPSLILISKYNPAIESDFNLKLQDQKINVMQKDGHFMFSLNKIPIFRVQNTYSFTLC